jgi:hypothetical protein
LILLDSALSDDLCNYKLAEEFIANVKNWYDGVLSDDCAMLTENGDISVAVGIL